MKNSQAPAETLASPVMCSSRDAIENTVAGQERLVCQQVGYGAGLFFPQEGKSLHDLLD